MGNECRLTLWFAGVLALQAALGCSRDDTLERRRQLLAATDRAQARKERIDKARVRSPTGDLLPSEQKVAGFVLPRGFTLKRSYPHKWIYDARLPQAKVEEYFDKRLTVSKVPAGVGEVLYNEAREKSDPNHAPGWIRVLPTPSKEEWTRLIITDPVPATGPAPPPEELAKTRGVER